MNLLAEIKEGFLISFDAIRSNKLRSALTTLGIVIGIVTVTLMGTAITGLNRAFMDSISAIGADMLYVQRTGWFIRSHAEWLKVQNRPQVTLVQERQFERQFTMARAITPASYAWLPVKYKNQSSGGVQVIGTTDQFLLTSAHTMAEGRFLSPDESDGGRPVCVLGFQVASNLFLTESPIGKKVRLGPAAFEVIGVMERQGQMLGFSLDNRVVVPLKQFAAQFRAFPDIEIQVRVTDLEKLDEAKEELRGAMRKVRGVRPGDEDNFAINQQENFISTFRRVAGMIATVGLFITALSLFVGGIGIMNIMYVSVAERTKEIGTRKAIGAKRRTILIQFLIEAATICMLGGLMGLAIAWPITLVLQKFFPATMSFGLAGLAILVSLLTGLISGFFPAWRAARMNPVDALRNE
jgi:putative ABC transport system permease protein